MFKYSSQVIFREILANIMHEQENDSKHFKYDGIKLALKPIEKDKHEYQFIIFKMRKPGEFMMISNGTITLAISKEILPYKRKY